MSKQPTQFNVINRRSFLKSSTLALAATAAGCAVNPVTGKQQLMLVSESQEISLDQENSPHQFSADYGKALDPELNAYLDQVGQDLAAVSHRPEMPYSFRAVNATYVNAYAFPGGSIAATRGILLELEDEAELAALMGHEIGHVSARHTAARMSTGMLAQLAVAGLAIAVSTQDSEMGALTAGLGGIGAGLLLAKYSRDDERQADKLGMRYMVKGGYDPQGMVGLMDVLRSMSKHKPNAIEQMFASHPMSDERYATAQLRIKNEFPQFKGAYHRERYMDNTARLRSIKVAIDKMQDGQTAMAKENFRGAEREFKEALGIAPDDYAGLLLMGKCQMAMEQWSEARHYFDEAEAVYPEEPQVYHLKGYTNLVMNDFDSAYSFFAEYQDKLPGNPNTFFLKGLALEGMDRRREAAEDFYEYLQYDQQTDQAKYAYNRLVEWGYIQPQQQQ